MPGQEEAKEQELISLKAQSSDLSIQIAAAVETGIKYSKQQLDSNAEDDSQHGVEHARQHAAQGPTFDLQPAA